MEMHHRYDYHTFEVVIYSVSAGDGSMAFFYRLTDNEGQTSKLSEAHDRDIDAVRAAFAEIDRQISPDDFFFKKKGFA